MKFINQECIFSVANANGYVKSKKLKIITAILECTDINGRYCFIPINSDKIISVGKHIFVTVDSPQQISLSCLNLFLDKKQLIGQYRLYGHFLKNDIIQLTVTL